MGYQESFVTAPDFPALVEITNKLGNVTFDAKLVEPVLVITLLKDILVQGETHPKGRQYLYFSGERHYQRSIESLYDSKQPRGTQLWFTEQFPSEAIFADGSTIATLEKFKL